MFLMYLFHFQYFSMLFQKGFEFLMFFQCIRIQLLTRHFKKKIIFLLWFDVHIFLFWKEPKKIKKIKIFGCRDRSWRERKQGTKKLFFYLYIHMSTNITEEPYKVNQSLPGSTNSTTFLNRNSLLTRSKQKTTFPSFNPNWTNSLLWTHTQHNHLPWLCVHQQLRMGSRATNIHVLSLGSSNFYNLFFEGSFCNFRRDEPY